MKAIRSAFFGEPTPLAPDCMLSSQARSRFLSAAGLVLLVGIWVVAGLVGHDPWKPDEAYTFGIVLDFLEHGDWVVPRLAGEVFLEKPPLFFITAAGFAALLGNFLPLHDAARLASGFYMAWALVFVALTTRELRGGRGGWQAVLILIGCLGLFVRGHQLITDLTLFAGVATGMYGLARSRRSVVVGGFALGVGVLMAFLAKGLLGPGFLGLTAFVLLLFPAWRHRTYVRALALAAVVGLPGILAWVVVLYQRSPELLHEWLVLNNLGRFLGFTNLGPPSPHPGFYPLTLLWYAFPALPLTVWTLWDTWRDRRAVWADPGLQLPGVMFVVMLVVLGAAHDARELYLMPTLLPLALLAAARVDRLPSRIATALERLALWATGVLTGGLWLGWLMMMVGAPEAFHRFVLDLQPGFTPTVVWPAVAVALAVTTLWIWLARPRQHVVPHHVVRWAAGMTMCWTLVMTLWLPLLDAGKSYRAMIASLAQALPDGVCVASRNLGEPQRALLKYFAGVVTLRRETATESDCDALLVQDWQDASAPAPDFDGALVWEGARPGDHKELYRLYVRGARADLLPQHFPVEESAWAGSSTPDLSRIGRSQRRLVPLTPTKSRF